jgi:hypothetical protein
MTLIGINDPYVGATVVGDGLLLTTASDGQMELQISEGGQSQSLGTFASASAAWSALDALDLAA